MIDYVIEDRMLFYIGRTEVEKLLGYSVRWRILGSPYSRIISPIILVIDFLTNYITKFIGEKSPRFPE